MPEHNQWLELASNELKTAQLLLKNNHDFAIGTILYLSQQCAEKALKGYLSYHDQEIKKTHDLSILVTLCATLDPDFSTLMKHARELNPFNAGTRYPDDNFISPDLSLARHALNLASQIIDFVKAKIA